MGEMMILYENEPMELLSKIYPLTIGNNFVKLVRKNMRGTKESKLDKTCQVKVVGSVINVSCLFEHAQTDDREVVD